MSMTTLMQTMGLFTLTAAAEILGCWLVWLWARHQASAWWLLPAAISLAAFAWLLTLHPAASGRVYASYGGVYVACAILWLWAVDGMQPNRYDLLGTAVILLGASIIVIGNWSRT